MQMPQFESRTFRLRSRAGLSLQEMLIVLAVFIVLAGLFILSSREVLSKTRVARVRQEQKVLAGALYDYQAEMNDFPTEKQGLADLLVSGRYVSSIPKDPFSKQDKPGYQYYRLPTTGAGRPMVTLLISVGPDGVPDFDPLRLFLDGSGFSAVNGDSADTNFVYPANLIDLGLTLSQYDPTNGIHSRGDIIIRIE